jgi:protein-S-isoprenylcysteine O-methyltransferase Ste14
MDAESPFRIALVIVILLTTIVTSYHRLRAASSKESISRKEEGYLFAVVLRLSGLGLFVVTLAYLIAPQSVHWAMFPIPRSIRGIGAVTGILCSILMFWTLNSLGKNLTDTVVTRKNATLVTHGPYRWVRHPFYVTTALVMFSATLLTANWLIGVGSFFVLAMLAIRTPKEEQKLVERFGQQYLDYMARTNRFFPRKPTK